MKSKSFRAACLAVALAVATLAYAQAPDPEGKWDIEVDMNGQVMEASLVVTKNDDGTYGGVLNSLMGELVVESVEYSAGEQISFAETIGEGDAAVEFKFEGKFTGPDSFEGELTMQLGILPVKGTRAKDPPAVAGTWDVTSDSQLGVLERVLTINDDWSGTYAGDDAWAIEELSVEGDTVKFSVTVDVQGQELPLDFEGTFAGKELTGDFFADGSSVSAVTGTKRVIGGLEVLVGSWEMVADTPLGIITGMMVVNEDGTAKFVWEDGEVDAEDFTIEHEYIELSVNVLHEGAEYFVDFEGEITSESALEGDYILDGSPVATVEGTKK